MKPPGDGRTMHDMVFIYSAPDADDQARMADYNRFADVILFACYQAINGHGLSIDDVTEVLQNVRTNIVKDRQRIEALAKIKLEKNLPKPPRMN